MVGLRVERTFALITFNEEQYISIAEVAKRLQVAHGTCKSNVLPLLTECHLPGRKRPVYKLTEVEELSQVRVVERQPQPLTLVKKVAP
jgi:hypothetical protein